MFFKVIHIIATSAILVIHSGSQDVMPDSLRGHIGYIAPLQNTLYFHYSNMARI